MNHLIPSIEFPEIVIGLVAPIGTPLKATISALKNDFESNNYLVQIIKVTDVYNILERFIPPEHEKGLTDAKLIDRYHTYISYGNQIREKFNDNSLLAALTIYRIMEQRLRTKRKREKFEKVVYIIDQFKRPEEVDLLRSVYGSLFFQISVYSRRAARVDYLARRFAQDEGEANPDRFRSEAEALITDDHIQQSHKYGQRVSKIFHDGDFLVNKDINSPDVASQIHRFVEILFSANSYTPTKYEYGMFAAKSAALRTADLSRQVGAAIFTRKGEVVSLGSNEVPKAGGGTYWPDDAFDDREFKRGYDSNDARKNEILSEILKILDYNLDQIGDTTSRKLKDAALMDALEYGRIIHAEMSAISDAARLGRPIQDCILFTTTFPCHMCAKHILASGISEVVFLEPYPKSLASRLHADSTSIESQERGEYADYPAVQFVHFYGVTPRRYREFFERARRKDSKGNFEEYSKGTKRPYIDLKSPFYAQLEEAVAQSVGVAISEFGLSLEHIEPPEPQTP
jgi:Deoxycytidylate deaminase